ncbi:Hypp3225 [Branchiostoma lanceolatum]|uniref:Hypp3225 protein n=1 Tax=Branchiostoma lanceolatum TaxID=7740 RepID=A0A8J9ZYJ8_BRALA|nr:Hypp3225 [Branchiostoma lanceolatum]
MRPILLLAGVAIVFGVNSDAWFFSSDKAANKKVTVPNNSGANAKTSRNTERVNKPPVSNFPFWPWDSIQPPAAKHPASHPAQPPAPKYPAVHPVQPPAPKYPAVHPVQPPAPNHPAVHPVQPPAPNHPAVHPVQPPALNYPAKPARRPTQPLGHQLPAGRPIQPPAPHLPAGPPTSGKLHTPATKDKKTKPYRYLYCPEKCTEISGNIDD